MSRLPTAPGEPGALDGPRAGLQLQRSFQGRIAALLAERGIVAALFLAASLSVVATVAIFTVLVWNGWDFFQEVPMTDFLLGTEWAPDFLPPRYGALPLLKGTFLVGLGAAAIGIPVAVGTAIYLSEFATDRVRSLLKPSVELLAGIPSIMFAIVALFTISPIIQDLFDVGVFSALNAIIVLGIMVVPIIASLSDDALRAVPRDLREGALALGATPWESTRHVVVPAAASGITAAVLLGFSRAIGETMVVTLAAGLVATMSLNPLEPTQTITAYMANRAGGDLPTGSIAYLSLFAIGAVLFVMTFVLNVAAAFALVRQRRRFA